MNTLAPSSSAFMRLFVLLALSLGLALAAAPVQPVHAQGATPAQSGDNTHVTRRPKPDLSQLERLRFFTDSDYPPFNYLDEEGALTGFNVDLARALCDELSVECSIRSVTWQELVPALTNAEADAVIASIRVTEKTLEKLDFTDPYYFTPGRFVAQRDSPLRKTSPEALAGKRIGVVENSAHAAYLADFYGRSRHIPYPDTQKLEAALLAGDVDMIFGDGITLMFWLNGTLSQQCCEFRGGAYAESRYFGEGIGIAVRRGDRRLRAILDYGLEQLRSQGRLEELYLRYFPLSFY
ncbi:MAG: ABC transporter substrate-binding protein [Alphaproteobacteria bacterium]|nr:MAG: ABC transporter substrate-binding protein [Alphaproteobacteria bacterium]